MQSKTTGFRLFVHIAERSHGRAHELLDLARRTGSEAIFDKVLERSLVAGRHVEHGLGAKDCLLTGHPLLAAQLLPDPPGLVNHAVVQVEDGVTGASVDVHARVTTCRFD